jgi:signal transduction histidine kinase
MKFTFDKKIKAGYFSAFILLLISFLLSVSGTNKIVKQSKWTSEKNELIIQQEILLSALKDMETMYRGYLLINKKEMLDLYYKGKIQVDSSIKRIAYLLKNDFPENKGLQSLQNLINNETATLNNGLALFIASRLIVTDPVKNISYQGQEIMDSIREQVIAMQAPLRERIYQKNPDAERTLGYINTINFTSLIIAILIISYSLRIYINENEARRKSTEQALLYRKQLELRLEELNIANRQLNERKSIEKFASTGRIARMIAHEVRNPLTNIGLANDQLKEFVERNEEGTMLLNMIKKNGERINHLVSDLLNATRFAELNKAEFSINDLMEDVVVITKDQITLNTLKIEKYYSSKSCRVFGDAEKLKIAFLNIFVNAIEAVEPGKGIIKVTTFLAPGNMCSVKINDNGIGMSQEIISKLFEPFFTNKNKGGGLGLTNAQNIIFNHGGNVDVESMPGSGSTITVNLLGI